MPRQPHFDHPPAGCPLCGGIAPALSLRGWDKFYLPFHLVEGGWMVGDPPGKLPLYRLPELIGAGRVFVGEAKKVAEALHQQLGLTATKPAHGAKVRPARLRRLANRPLGCPGRHQEWPGAAPAGGRTS
jgi:hypothetical protein